MKIDKKDIHCVDYLETINNFGDHPDFNLCLVEIHLKNGQVLKG